MIRKCNPDEVVVLYTERHFTCRQIADMLKISPSFVSKIINRSGFTGRDGEYVREKCSFCGMEFEILRSRWRKQRRHYCTHECYCGSRYNPKYAPSRNGQYIARKLVMGYFKLEHPNVVHHKDGDDSNNRPSNLLVFATHADHMRHHHGGEVDPLWDGAEVVEIKNPPESAGVEGV